MATAMGHLDQLRKNVRSTRQCKRPSDKEVKEFDQDVNPDTNTTTNQAFAGMIDMHAKETLEGRSYLDLMGHFLSKSQDGNLYVLVLYTYDDNAIIMEPLKNRTEGEQLAAYTWILNRVASGTPLQMHWMDNEVSAGLKSLLTKEFGLAYQLAPPHIHHRNATEQAIQTFKNHFIAGLCSADDDFPIRLWDKLLNQ
jgi:hypothetical protein